MKRFGLFALAGILAAAAPGFAAFTLPINAAAITAVTTNASPLPDDIAVDSTGRIIFADRAVAANEQIVRFNGDGTGGALIQTGTNIIAAIELVNGTSTQTLFTIRGIDVAADGDIIVLTDGGGETATLVSIAPTSPFAITVLCCSKDGGVSTVEGSGVLRMIGNTAYVGYNGAFGGPAGDAIVSIDTNSVVGLPNLTSTTVATQTNLEAAVTGLAAPGALNLGPITSTPGGNLIVADSNASGTTDDLVLVTLPAGTCSLLVDSTDTIADLSGASVTDLGYGGLAVAPNGDIYGADNFGAPSGDTGRGIVQLVGAAGGSATATLINNQTVRTDIGGAAASFPSLGRCVYDATGSRVLYANSAGDRIGIVSQPITAAVSDWSMY